MLHACAPQSVAAKWTCGDGFSSVQPSGHRTRRSGAPFFSRCQHSRLPSRHSCNGCCARMQTPLTLLITLSSSSFTFVRDVAARPQIMSRRRQHRTSHRRRHSRLRMDIHQRPQARQRRLVCATTGRGLSGATDRPFGPRRRRGISTGSSSVPNPRDGWAAITTTAWW